MNVQHRLAELSLEVRACGECLINSYTYRHLRPYLDAGWRHLFSQHCWDEPVELRRRDFDDLRKIVLDNLAAKVAEKLTT